MSDKELVDEIHSCLSGSDMLQGVSACFELATVNPDKAARIFTSYRPKIIEALYGWAREVNDHVGVFLPHSLFESEAPRAYEEMREFEAKYGGIIDVQAQAKTEVREHVRRANSMKAQRHAITQAIDGWHTDRESRSLCGTDDPERLAQNETTAIEIAVDLIKEALKEKGIKISKVDREDLRHTAIKAVKENKEILKEASRRERQMKKILKDLTHHPKNL